MKHERFVDTITALQTKGTISQIVSPSPPPLQYSNTEYDTILADFPTITKPRTSTRPVKHSVTHHIRTTGPPIYARGRQLTPDRLRIAW